MLSNTYGYIGNRPAADDNTVLVTDSGSVWSNLNDLSVGYYGSINSLTISNGGAVYNGYGYIGLESSSSNNTVLVTGSGSVWNNATNVYVGYYSAGNSLSIANGGAVYDPYGYIGYQADANSNTGLVSDPSSIWNNGGSLTVGTSGSGNSLTITNGAVVADGGSGHVGDNPGATNNTVLVTGSGSVWSNAHYLYVGSYGSGNSLTIANGGAVFSSFLGTSIGLGGNNNAVIVTGAGSVWNSNDGLLVGADGGAGNTLTITNGGSVYVTNTAANATLVVSQAGGGINSLIINGGSVTADALTANDDKYSVITFNAGWLASAGTTVSNSQQFVVGDGTHAATYQMVDGTHTFNNGLRIRNNAVLTGCGIINGTLVVDSGALVLADCGGALQFGGSMTNNGTVRATNGTKLIAFNPVVNNHILDIINGGGTNFHSLFINTGTVLDASSVKVAQVEQSGQDFIVQVPSFTGHTYQLQYTTSLAPENWMDTGGSQAGTGIVLTFTDFGGATNMPSRFYRVGCTAP